MASVTESCAQGWEHVLKQLHNNATARPCPLAHIHEHVRPVMIDSRKRLQCGTGVILSSVLNVGMPASLHEGLHRLPAVASQ